MSESTKELEITLVDLRFGGLGYSDEETEKSVITKRRNGSYLWIS